MREKDAPPDRYRELIKDGILNEATFVQVVFGGRRRGHTVPWNRVVIRPVLIRDKRRAQFSYFAATKDTTKNYARDEVGDKVDELLALPFKSISLQTIEHDIQVQITNKGKVIIHQHKAPEGRELPSLRHDRQKTLILPADKRVLGTVGRDRRTGETGAIPAHHRGLWLRQRPPDLCRLSLPQSPSQLAGSPDRDRRQRRALENTG